MARFLGVLVGGTRMTRLFKTLIVNSALAMTLLSPVGVFAFQAKDVPSKTAATPGPSDRAISAAKARGLVWVGKNTKVYYKAGELYGKGEGEFMPEAEAQKAGNREQKHAEEKE
jgi:hypothetical protein